MSAPIRLYDLAAAEDDRLFSPYCWRVKMALGHKGLEYETIPWRFTEKDAIAFSGQGSVPVIVDGGREVHDSWAIALYLNEAYPGRPLLFGSDEARTLAYFFKNWCERALHPAFMRVIILDLFGHLHEKDQAYFRETREKRYGTTLERFGADPPAALARVRAALEPVRPVLAEHPFVSGRGPGFSDYILFGAFQWVRSVSPATLVEPGDPIYSWRERILDLHGGLARKTRAYPVQG